MSKLPLKKSDTIRVRIAPSPTGPLHIGTARTALFNYLFARKNQGNFILRIEDTDLERSDPKWEKDVVENLKWLGILWDEGPDIGGKYKPYRQSERKDIYEKYIKKLYDEGYLYWCFCTKEELEAQREDQMARGEAPRYMGRCRNLSLKEQEKFRQEGRKGILRFKVPEKIIKVNDLIRGKLEFNTSLLGDIAVAKDFSIPLYNFAVVVDDFEMKINYVIRGEDHISNIPKQVLFQEALGFPRPNYAHLPLILGPDRSKLSKRHGAVKVQDYKEDGYLPEALINFMALLGWNPGTKEEIFSLEELTKKFSLERVQKGGAIFNIERLNWINGYYIRRIPLAELTEKCIPYLIKSQISKDKSQNKFQIKATGEIIDFNYLKNIVALFQERLKKLSEISELADFFFKDKLEYDKSLLFWQKITEKDLQKNLKKCYKILKKLKENEWQREKIKEVLLKEAEKEINRGYILWPLRVSLTGKKASPPPFEVAEILGKEKTLKRIEEALQK
ncbi:MAG TPA: glutamate--tRNA ligase [Candidatus Pacearchaeota archaeon]|nr:glutamate--tRNA ligase [Candidatus Pacearchaeota archaeon]